MANAYGTVFDALPKLCPESGIDVCLRIILSAQYVYIAFNEEAIISFYQFSIVGEKQFMKLPDYITHALTAYAEIRLFPFNIFI